METPELYTAFDPGWQCTKTDQHFRIDGPGLSFVCKFPTRLIKAGNPECRYWHLGAFDILHDLAKGWEIIQSSDQCSMTARIPDSVGQWLAGQVESQPA